MTESSNPLLDPDRLPAFVAELDSREQALDFLYGQEYEGRGVRAKCG